MVNLLRVRPLCSRTPKSRRRCDGVAADLRDNRKIPSGLGWWRAAWLCAAVELGVSPSNEVIREDAADRYALLGAAQGDSHAHVAIDLGGKESQVCVRAADGQILHESKIA